MNEPSVALITFVCTFGAALLATFARSSMPPAHVSKESQDVVRLGMGLVATMTALLLGLVTASAKGSFDTQDAAVRTSATNLLTLDRHLARYGPETVHIREEIRSVVEFRIEATWPTRGAGRSVDASQTTARAEQIQNDILALTPASDTQRWFKTQALVLIEDVLKTRWRALESARASVPATFLVVVIFWLSMTFASFGLYAPRNATVLVALLVASLSVSAAILLLLELASPFDGLIKVSGRPFHFLLSQLGQ